MSYTEWKTGKELVIVNRKRMNNEREEEGREWEGKGAEGRGDYRGGLGDIDFCQHSWIGK